MSLSINSHIPKRHLQQIKFNHSFPSTSTLVKNSFFPLDLHQHFIHQLCLLRPIYCPLIPSHFLPSLTHNFWCSSLPPSNTQLHTYTFWRPNHFFHTSQSLTHSRGLSGSSLTIESLRYFLTFLPTTLLTPPTLSMLLSLPLSQPVSPPTTPS